MFSLTISTDSAAFGEDEQDNLARACEVARILAKAANEVSAGSISEMCRDFNGNAVGSWGFAGPMGQPAPGPEVLDALHWIVLQAVESFTDNEPRSTPESTRDELRALVAVVDWLDAAGVRDIAELRGAMPNDQRAAEILRWTDEAPAAPPPGFEVFETPSGRWAWEKLDGSGCSVGHLDRAAALASANLSWRGEG